MPDVQIASVTSSRPLVRIVRAMFRLTRPGVFAEECGGWVHIQHGD